MYIRFPAVVLSLVGVLVALLTRSLTALIVFEAALAVLCLFDALLAPSPKRISAQRSGPTEGHVDENLTHVITLKSTARRRITGTLRDAWPPSVQVTPKYQNFQIPAGGKAELAQTLTPRRRGTRLAEHLTLRTVGPLRLAGRQRSFPQQALLRVLPPFKARKNLPSRLKRLRELEGRTLLLVRGEGTEFDSLREYVPGDDVRAIDWRSSARLGQTLVRTWRPERDRTVVIVVDSGRGGAMRFGEHPAFDAYMESALLLAAVTTRAGDRVHVLALDTQERMRVVDPAPSQVLNRLAQGFADVEPAVTATDWRLASTYLRKAAPHRALVVVLSSLSLGSISDGLQDFIAETAQRHTVIVGSLRREALSFAKPSDAEDAYETAAAARSSLETKALLRALGQQAHVVMSDDEEALPPSVTDAYINLKAAGKL